MPIIRINTVVLPATFPGSYMGAFPQSQTATDVVTVQQVMGLVPLFECCDGKEAVGGFQFGHYDTTSCNSGTVTLNINLAGSDLGNFSFISTDTNTDIEADIQALLPTGWTCKVIGTFMLRSCIISPPVGSGSTGNAVLIVTKVGTGCGGVIRTLNIAGGVTSTVDCANCDCREGKYNADSINDDRNFTLPVFADLSCTDSYHNDSNSWLIQYPGTYDPISNTDYQLQELINGVWTKIANLDSTNYGIPYNNNFFTGTSCQPVLAAGKCDNVNYGGFKIQWQKVLTAFGEGTYRFYVSGGYTSDTPYCFKSPPFCLKTWDCIDTNGTVKFETNVTGGNFGSVTTQGVSWSLCCQKTVSTIGSTQVCSNGIYWYDSIRIFGYFGYENTEVQRDQIKYATGIINKIRDEVIKTFLARTSQLPMWFHRRFYSYGLMADQLFVSDYNLDNDSYEYKHFFIVSDGAYTIKHNNSTRYPKAIDFKFKEGQQFVFRDRCCSASSLNLINPGGDTDPGNDPTNPPDTTRLFADLTPHLWADLQQSAFPP